MKRLFEDIDRARRLLVHPSKRPSCAARAGFTLVELLVVVALAGLLASMLMPALGRARDKTDLLTCRVHLRNVCIGALLYAGDNSGALPIDKMLGPSYEGVENSHNVLFAALDGYVAMPANYYCPSEISPELMYSMRNFEAGVMGYYYYCCSQATGNRDISTFLRWDVKWPRLLRDTMHPQTWVISDCWFRDRPTSHRGFRKAVNYATLGAAVDMVYDSPRQQFR